MNAHVAFDRDALPTSVEAEQGLLGAVLMNNAVFGKIAHFLKSDHFSEALHGELWSLVSSHIGQGRVANPITLKALLPETPNLDLTAYMAKLVANAMPPSMCVDLARTITEQFYRREAIFAGRKLVDLALDAHTPVLKGLSEVVRDLSGIDAQARSERRVTDFGSVLSDAFDGLQDSVTNDSTIDFFLPEITAVTGKMRTGNLVGLLSDSGGGKTSFALQQCDYVAGQNIPCAFFSIEITAEEAALQIASQRLSIDMDRLDRLELSDKEIDAFHGELERARRLPLSIVPFADCSIEDIRSQCLNLVRQNGVKLVVIDHAKFITLPGKTGDLFSERVNALYRGLKSIAKQLGITIIILIQRNDSWKKRDSARPIDGDCYGGGSVKQAMDCLLALYRPEPLYEDKLSVLRAGKEADYYRSKLDGMGDQSVRGKAWFINMKRRRGQPKQDRVVKFVGKFTRFEALEREQEDLGI